MITEITTESELYNDLKAAIEAIPEIKEVKLYNSDVAEITQGRQSIFQFPAVFVEFEYGDHGTDYGRRQQIDLTVRLYVCAFNLKVSDTYLFELKNKVHRVAQGLGAAKDSYVPLNRIDQRQDIDHGNMPLWSMDYSTAYVDNGAEEVLQEVTVQTLSVDGRKLSATEPTTDITLNLHFVAGASGVQTIDIGEEEAGRYSYHEFTNISAASYKVNTLAVSFPFNVVAGDQLEITATITDTALKATVKLEGKQ